jgi:hypothetical protein
MPNASDELNAEHDAVAVEVAVSHQATFDATPDETVGMAAEVAHGSCTDLPPMRKK